MLIYTQEITPEYKLCYYIDINNKDKNDRDKIIDKLKTILQLSNNNDIDYNSWIEWGYINNNKHNYLIQFLSKFNITDINIINTHLQKKEYFNPNQIDTNIFKIYENGFHITNTNNTTQPKFINIDTIEDYINQNYLSFNHNDIIYYKNLFKDIMERHPTNMELTFLGQLNSECIQKWFINGIIYIDNIRTDNTLQDLLNSLSHNNNILYSNNKINIIYPSIPYYTSKYTNNKNIYHTTYNIYDNNYQTACSPFNGSALCISNRIKETICKYKTSKTIASITGFCIGNLNLDLSIDKNNDLPIDSLNRLIRMSNGTSYHSNRSGEPIIGGFTRIYGNTIEYTQINTNNEWGNNSFNQKNNIREHIEYIKPVIYCGGIGKVNDICIDKESPFKEALVVHIGDPSYKIGIASTSTNDILYNPHDKNIINNGINYINTITDNKLYKFIQSCNNLTIKNPIISSQPINRGGIGTAILKLISPFGITINIDNIPSQSNLSPYDIWNSENDAQILLLIQPKALKLLQILGRRENIDLNVIGICKPDDKLKVINKKGEKFINLNISDIFINKRCRRYDLTSHIRTFKNTKLLFRDKQRFTTDLYNVLQHPSVASKRFIMNKTDRSIGGLVVQQQCVGPHHIPISDYSIVADSFTDYSGVVSAIGEQSIYGIVDVKSMIEMSLSEMLLSLMFCKIDSFKNIMCNPYWAYPCDSDSEKYRFTQSVIHLHNIIRQLDITIGESAENTNMSSKLNDTYVKSPPTFSINGISNINDFRKRVTPNIKREDNSVLLIYLGSNKHLLGNSILATTRNEIGSSEQMPRFGNIDRFKVIWDIIQDLIIDGLIISGHDVSDGGVITTILEMCFAGNYGIVMNIMEEIDPNHFFYSQEMAIVIETDRAVDVMNKLGHLCDVIYIGETVKDDIIDITFNGEGIFFNKMSYLRNIWDTTSQKIESETIDPIYVIDDNRFIKNTQFPIEKFPENYMLRNIDGSNGFKRSHKVAVLRDDGITGHNELANAFYSAGFYVYDLHLNDIIREPRVINEFRGICFPCGFTYNDIFNAGYGQSEIIKNNTQVWNEFQKFFRDKSKFSVGFGNGCQLMGEFGIIPYKFKHNLSRRFESRWSYIRLKSANSPFLKGMDGSILGVWSCHGEGRAIKQRDNDSVIAQYVDWDGNRTEKYPYNPNGSEFGVAGCTSKSGRHLAIMSHPERSIFKYQVPWSGKMDDMTDTTPWYKIFTNIWDWSNN